MKPKGIVWLFLFLAGIAVQVFPQQFIQTNAVGGIFSSDQKLIFAITEPGWLRILINDVEIYRGIGPAYPELGAPWGEERSFFLAAKYYSPDNVLVESLFWYIVIDKKYPAVPDMEFRTAAEILERSRADSLALPAPVITGVPEGGWTRGPVTISAASEEEGVTAYISARLRYASGALLLLNGTGSLDIASSRGEAAEVSVEARLVDLAGNYGPKTVLNFTIDPKTIFVSPHPLIQVSGAPGPVGGKDNPFTSLQEALDYAVSYNFEDIRIAGTLELREPVTVYGTIRIDGGWRRKPGSAEIAGNRAVLVLGNGFFWDLKAGAELAVSGVRAERESGEAPLIRAGSGAKLTLNDSVFTHSGPFLVMDGGAAEIDNTQIFTRVFGEKRTAAFSARQSEIQIINSRMQLEGNYGLVFYLKEGSFFARDSIFLCAGRRTATVFALNRSRAAFESLTLSAAAGDYASVIESFGSELVLNGGTLGASARDTSALLFHNSPALLSGTRIFVEGAFTARALDIRGIFPDIKNCRFYSTGSARRSEVFSGAEGIEPPSDSITGNSFSGFTHIHERLPAGRVAFE